MWRLGQPARRKNSNLHRSSKPKNGGVNRGNRWIFEFFVKIACQIVGNRARLTLAKVLLPRRPTVTELEIIVVIMLGLTMLVIVVGH